MSDDYRSQLVTTLGMRETEDLLDIWQTNDRAEWSDEAFDVIREILISRGVLLPEQDEAILEHVEADEADEDRDFTAEELAIIDDDNPPDFYNPLQVLQLTKWMGWLVKAYIVFIILVNLSSLPSIVGTVSAYVPQYSQSLGVYLVSAVIMIVQIGIAVVVYTVFFKVLSSVLRILMQMEFNSRKAGPMSKSA